MFFKNNRKKNKVNPVEIIFIYNSDGHIIDDDFQRYYDSLYDSDPQKLLKSAIKNGFLIYGKPIDNVWSASTNRLKEILRENKLKISGKKEILEERIKENIPSEKLNEYFPEKRLKISELGKQLICENDHIIFYHNCKHFHNSNISLNDYLKLFPKKFNKSTKYDVSIDLFNGLFLKNLKNKDYGLARNSLYSISKIYFERNDYINSLKFILQVCYLDLSGLHNNNLFSIDLISLAPGIISELEKLLELLNIDTKDLEKLFIDSIKKIKIKRKLISDDNKFLIITKSLDLNYDELESFIKKTIKAKN